MPGRSGSSGPTVPRGTPSRNDPAVHVERTKPTAVASWPGQTAGSSRSPQFLHLVTRSLDVCGCPKLCTHPLTCCVAATTRPACSAGGAELDPPVVLQAHELGGAMRLIGRHQGDRDPGPAPAARSAPTTHVTARHELGRSRSGHRPNPTATSTSTTRPARHTIHHPALAPGPSRPRAAEAASPRPRAR